jgi:hypothetical protein
MNILAIITMAVCTFLMMIFAIISKAFYIGVGAAAIIVIGNLANLFVISYWFAALAVVIPVAAMLITWVLAAIVTLCGAILGISGTK